MHLTESFIKMYDCPVLPALKLLSLLIQIVNIKIMWKVNVNSFLSIKAKDYPTFILNKSCWCIKVTFFRSISRQHLLSQWKFEYIIDTSSWVWFKQWIQANIFPLRVDQWYISKYLLWIWRLSKMKWDIWYIFSCKLQSIWILLLNNNWSSKINWEMNLEL